VTRPVVFLTDFGLQDEFVGICHGVVARIAPDARVIDLTHGVPPQDVRRGAILLARAAGYVPDEAVFLAIVDPEVGGSRRAVALATNAGAILIGPDNGVLSLAWERLGGVCAAHAIEAEQYRLHPTSATFHARDVFAPAAAHVADGLPIEALGPAIPFMSLEAVTVPPAVTVPGELRATVLGVDTFGNVELNGTEDDERAAGLTGSERLTVQIGEKTWSFPRRRTFADVPPGEPAVLLDSSGWLTIVVNQGNAAERFSLSTDDELVVRPDSA
jgi:S-adenosyl-L-methionine hydrolase (adenosine-forming)